jgi:hypothetical protein
MSCSINHQLFPSCEFICVISVCPSRAHNWNKIYLIIWFIVVAGVHVHFYFPAGVIYCIVWGQYQYILYSVAGIGKNFLSRRLWPLTWPHQGAILENNVPFQISNVPQLWLVKLRASLCSDKYHFLRLV